MSREVVQVVGGSQQALSIGPRHKQQHIASAMGLAFSKHSVLMHSTHHNAHRTTRTTTSTPTRTSTFPDGLAPANHGRSASQVSVAPSRIIIIISHQSTCFLLIGRPNPQLMIHAPHTLLTHHIPLSTHRPTVMKKMKAIKRRGVEAIFQVRRAASWEGGGEGIGGGLLAALGPRACMARLQGALWVLKLG